MKSSLLSSNKINATPKTLAHGVKMAKKAITSPLNTKKSVQFSQEEQSSDLPKLQPLSPKQEPLNIESIQELSDRIAQRSQDQDNPKTLTKARSDSLKSSSKKKKILSRNNTDFILGELGSPETPLSTDFADIEQSSNVKRKKSIDTSTMSFIGKTRYALANNIGAIFSVRLLIVALQKPLKFALLLVVSYALIVLSYGMFYRHWDSISSMYFMMATLTTVGFGDYSFAKHHDYDIGTVIVCVSVLVNGMAIGVILSYLEEQREIAEEKQAAIELSEISSPNMNDVNGEDFSDIAPRKTSTERLEDHLKDALKYALFCVMLLIASIIFGGIVLANVEGWSLIKAIYFSAVTLTTIGYGDIVPNTEMGRLFVTIYLLITLPVTATAIGNIAQVPLVIRKLAMEYAVLYQFGSQLDLGELEALATSDLVRRVKYGKVKATGRHNEALQVTRAEFYLFVLYNQGKLTSNELQRLELAFNMLDEDGSNVLDGDDIANFIHSLEKPVE